MCGVSTQTLSKWITEEELRDTQTPCEFPVRHKCVKHTHVAARINLVRNSVISLNNRSISQSPTGNRGQHVNNIYPEL